MNWVAVPAKSLGFSYFNTYVNPANGLVLGWVARTGTGLYQVYFFDRNLLAGLAVTTRGTAQHAGWGGQGAIQDQELTVGLHQMNIPALTIQIMKHEQIQSVRGW